MTTSATTIQDDVWQYLATLPFEVSAPVIVILCRHDQELAQAKGLVPWLQKHHTNYYSDSLEFKYQMEAGERVKAIILALPELLAALKRADSVLFHLTTLSAHKVAVQEIEDAWRQLAGAMMKAKIV